MLRENLVILRNLHGYSQQEIALRIGISRQAYAKWETGATIPDIEKCLRLAEEYGVTVDSLIRRETVEGIGLIPPAPKGKNIWGTVTLNDRGQLVIPKAARERLGLGAGSRLVVLSDDAEGIALIPAEWFEAGMRKMMAYASLREENGSADTGEEEGP